MRVLLVSGGPRVTAQVTTALLGIDFSYTEVRTPERALKVLEEDPAYDLILADNDTHPTGGFFLSREVRLRVADGHELPPVVLLVARPQDEYLARWAEADAWLVKPVDGFDLAEVVEALVERRAVPSLPGVSTLSTDPSLESRPKPPISTGADFRVWSAAGASVEEEQPHEGQDPLPEGETPAGVPAGDRPYEEQRADGAVHRDDGDAGEPSS